jgi:hypothetical protein
VEAVLRAVRRGDREAHAPEPVGRRVAQPGE